MKERRVYPELFVKEVQNFILCVPLIFLFSL